jgi:hypothetical protein
VTNIYAIRTFDAPFVKLGTALDPDKRLKELQTGNPFKLFIHAVKKNVTRQDETQLHYRFSRFRATGEWFDWCDAVREEVDLWEKWDRSEISEHGNLVSYGRKRMQQEIDDLRTKVEVAAAGFENVRIGLKALEQCVGLGDYPRAIIDELRDRQCALLLRHGFDGLQFMGLHGNEHWTQIAHMVRTAKNKLAESA